LLFGLVLQSVGNDVEETILPFLQILLTLFIVRRQESEGPATYLTVLTANSDRYLWQQDGGRGEPQLTGTPALGQPHQCGG